jgi:hypothetical protein
VALLKGEPTDADAGLNRGPGGRRLRAVDNGDDLFGDDDEDGGSRQRGRELGGEGDLDELDFEEAPADDDEHMNVDDKEDEEAKELEVGLNICVPALPVAQDRKFASFRNA